MRKKKKNSSVIVWLEICYRFTGPGKFPDFRETSLRSFPINTRKSSVVTFFHSLYTVTLSLFFILTKLLSSRVVNSRQCFIGYPNTSNFVKNTPLRVVFSSLFSVFGYPDETLSLLFDILRKIPPHPTPL